MPAPLLRGTLLRSIGNGGEVAPTVLLHGVCAVAGARAAAGGREPGSMLLRSVGDGGEVAPADLCTADAPSREQGWCGQRWGAPAAGWWRQWRPASGDDGLFIFL